MLLNLTILPGDGIGPEVTDQAVLVLQALADIFGHQLQFHRKNIGGAALTAGNDPLPADTLQACLFVPALEDCSPLPAGVVHGTDILIVRELLGGIYFGQPRSIEGPAGLRNALNTMRYGETEIERIAHIAFDLARPRRH